tara:strand:- start:708 stop:872 length:165 start_codon:yes stop_codon:yes gene_type:complete
MYIVSIVDKDSKKAIETFDSDDYGSLSETIKVAKKRAKKIRMETVVKYRTVPFL